MILLAVVLVFTLVAVYIKATYLMGYRGTSAAPAAASTAKQDSLAFKADAPPDTYDVQMGSFHEEL